MLWGAKVNGEQQRMNPSDIAMVYLPLFHINAQAYSIFPSLWAGSTVVLQPRFSATRFWDIATTHNCTWASMVGFCIKIMSEKPVPPNSFRLWGNAKCDQPTDAHFGLRTLGWFGMTETVAHPLCGEVDQPNKINSMGRVVPGYDIAVVDDDGTELPPGGSGELRIGGVRGLSLFAEYLHNPEATASSFDEKGRFMTGDRVTYDEAGFFDYQDRLKDMLKVGGENVGASEIERVIASVPAVGIPAVVGKPDDLRGELPVAFVTRGEDATSDEALIEAVLTTCREKLADFKVPTEVRVVDALPRGNLEKINKVELRRWLDS
jgi:carnitine-CoA ligase